jgi:hypothetical protein
MFHIHTNNVRSRLRLAASAIAVAAGLVGVSGIANATTTTLANDGSIYDLDASTDTAVIVPSGTEAVVVQSWGTWFLGTRPGLVTGTGGISSTSSCVASWACTANAPVITVESGGTLRVAGYQSYYTGFGAGYIFQSAVQATGDVIIEGEANQSWGQPAVTFLGSNSFLGNLTLYDGAIVNLGWNWSLAQTTFGTNTNIDLQGASSLVIYQDSTALTMGGMISAASTATVELGSGTLTVNGANTAASSFAGTLTIDAGSTFIVGDATHSSAVFGDVANQSATITVNSTTSSIGVLKGYGTIYGNVTNNGIVKPGGTTGTLGTLTINGSYTQSSSGQLIVEVSPTGASSLVVNGAATLDGSLVINLDSGTYGNAVYNVFSATSISGSLTPSTTGNVSGAIVGLQETTTGYNLVTEKASAAQTFGHVATANRSALYQFSRSLYDIIAFGAPAGSAAVSGGKVDVWVAPIGEIENVGRDGVGYEQKSYGLSLGAEHRFAWHNAALGGAFSYRAGNMDTKNETTTTSTNGYDMAVYGGADVQNARIDGMFFYNINDATSKRLMTTYGTAATDEKGWAWGASVQLSRNLFNDLVTPYLRGTFARVHQDGATESGTDTFDLAYNAINENTFAGDAGVRIHVLRPQEGRKIKLDVDLAVRHDFSDPGEITTGGFATLDGSSFTYKWKGDSANALLVGLSVSDTIIDKLEIFGRLNGSFSLYRRAGEISFGAKYHL